MAWVQKRRKKETLTAKQEDVDAIWAKELRNEKKKVRPLGTMSGG